MGRRLLGLMLLLAAVLTAAVRGDNALYVNGTLPLPANTMGRLEFSPTALTFTPSKAGAPVSLPYSAISSIEYGEKTGRHLALALAASPWARFARKRRHYLTIMFRAAGGQQGAIFEVGKHNIRQVLTTLSADSHVAVSYQSKEAQAYAEQK